MKYIFIFIMIYTLSSLTLMYQNKNYIKALQRAKQKGKLVSTGVKKSSFGKGSIAIIASDLDGIISYGEMVKGRTIFANFKQIESIQGLSLSKLKEKFMQEDSILQAASFIEEKIERKNKKLEVEVMKYEVEILEIGEMVPELMEMNDCIIIYDDSINDTDLRQISVIHTIGKLKSEVSVGDTLLIGSQEYKVTSVGDVAQKTLKNLGHCTIKFDGKSEVNLPGELHVEGLLPQLKAGYKITIK